MDRNLNERIASTSSVTAYFKDISYYLLTSRSLATFTEEFHALLPRELRDRVYAIILDEQLRAWMTEAPGGSSITMRGLLDTLGHKCSHLSRFRVLLKTWFNYRYHTFSFHTHI